MKKKVVWMLVVLLTLSISVQTISLADPDEYSDVVAHGAARGLASRWSIIVRMISLP